MDPRNVTLFGESAGATSTCAQLASPVTAGLRKSPRAFGYEFAARNAFQRHPGSRINLFV
ncbi:MAG TPA: carboxylesterase family protein [Amycolatopsis sp.]|nr:carboxylesterase family protein [Amycolatopsis sp.]